MSRTFRLVPEGVESYICDEFDDMLWELMKNAADKIHTSLEPLYSTIDPNLPTFVASSAEADEEEQKEGPVKWIANHFSAWSGSGDQAKVFLKRENKARAESKKPFLQDERTSMITDEETKKILEISFRYLVALMEFSSVWFRLQFNHFLYESFKKEMKKSFVHKSSEANWEQLIVPDPSVKERIELLEDQIKGLESSLQEAHRMSQKF